MLNTEILSMNKYCGEFESSFAKKQGRKHAVFVNNGSVANLLLIQSLINKGDLKRGDKVGFSALTWPTNVMPLLQLGLVPIAIDCELETLNVSPVTLRRQIKQMKAFFITNVLGFSDDISAIKAMCEQNDVLFIEDNCESLGSEVDGELLGNFGLAATFSFFVGHHMSTIEGGMVVTDDDELHRHLLIARTHGWDRNLNESDQNTLRDGNRVDDFYSKYTFYEVASNFRPNEVNGFIGTTQMKYWDEIVSKRAENFRRFSEAAALNGDFIHLDTKHMDVVSNFAMPVVCKSSDLAKIYRDRFADKKVEIRPIIAGNMTRQPFYKKHVTKPEVMKNADFVHANGFYFGNNPDMDDHDVETLVSLLKKR